MRSSAVAAAAALLLTASPANAAIVVGLMAEEGAIATDPLTGLERWSADIALAAPLHLTTQDQNFNIAIEFAGGGLRLSELTTGGSLEAGIRSAIRAERTANATELFLARNRVANQQFRLDQQNADLLFARQARTAAEADLQQAIGNKATIETDIGVQEASIADLNVSIADAESELGVLEDFLGTIGEFAGEIYDTTVAAIQTLTAEIANLIELTSTAVEILFQLNQDLVSTQGQVVQHTAREQAATAAANLAESEIAATSIILAKNEADRDLYQALVNDADTLLGQLPEGAGGESLSVALFGASHPGIFVRTTAHWTLDVLPGGDDEVLDPFGRDYLNDGTMDLTSWADITSGEILVRGISLSLDFNDMIDRPLRIDGIRIGLAGDSVGVFRSGGLPGVPEPATWAMMIMGFGAIGATVRRRRRFALPPSRSFRATNSPALTDR